MSLGGNRGLLSMIKYHENVYAKILIEIDNLYNATDSSNNTLLHYAVKYNNTEVVKFLIESGCAIDTRNEFGQTPGIKCIKNTVPCYTTIKLLLKAGANVRIADKSGVSILDKVDNIEWLTEDMTRFRILKMVLKHGNVLYMDCFTLVSGHKSIIKLLLDTNIDLNMTDLEGKTLVHALATNANPGVIELLRGRNYNINASDVDGWTPLMYATKNYLVNSVEFLLKQGADIEAININNETPLYIAYANYDEVEAKPTVQILLEHRANVQAEIDDDDFATIFDLYWQEFEFLKLPLAQLALEEALGTTINDFIREKLITHLQFKAYFKKCQEDLSIEICPSMKLFALLTSQRKLERCLQNEELAPKLLNFETSIDYYETVLRKRLSKAIKMVELRKLAVRIICKLLDCEYDSFPFVIDEIASHLEEQDIECLRLIENELC